MVEPRRAVARSSDPQTSHEAASSVHVTQGQREVLAAFEQYGDMTDEQLVERVTLTPSGARSRRAELVSLGIVRDSGSYATSSSGRRTTVWTMQERASEQDLILWRCVSCKAATLAQPAESTVDPRMRRGRCVGCDNNWSFYIGEKHSDTTKG